MSDIAVALLRGINVGGKNLLPMKALAEIFVQAGCTEVDTYIQSGNVVFRHSAGQSSKHIASQVHRYIEARFVIKVPVVIRTGEELYGVLASNPFLTPSCDLAQLHVMFLEDQPAAELVASLDATRSLDEFLVIGREIFLRLPNGVVKTKLTNAYFDAKLKTVSTQRNWRTVQTLAEMASEHSDMKRPSR